MSHHRRQAGYRTRPKKLSRQLRHAVLIEEGRLMYQRLQARWLAELQVPYNNWPILRSLETQLRLLEDAFLTQGLQL